MFSNFKSYGNLNFDEAEFGMYTNVSTPSSAGASNYPNNITGMLICFKGESFTIQFYVAINTAFYVRSRYGTRDFSAWKSVNFN